MFGSIIAAGIISGATAAGIVAQTLKRRDMRFSAHVSEQFSGLVTAVETRISPMEDKINLINGRMGMIEAGMKAMATREEVARAFQTAAEVEEQRRLEEQQALLRARSQEEERRLQAEEEQRQVAAIEQWQAQERERIRQELVAEQRRRGLTNSAQGASDVQVRFARPELGIPEPAEGAPWEPWEVKGQ